MMMTTRYFVTISFVRIYIVLFWCFVVLDVTNLVAVER